MLAYGEDEEGCADDLRPERLRRKRGTKVVQTRIKPSSNMLSMVGTDRPQNRIT